MTRLPTTTVKDDTLRRNIMVSGGIHFAGLLFLYFGLPIFLKPLPVPYVPVPFEIVDIADLTNTRIKDKPEEQPKPPEPQPKPEPEKAIAPPPPQPQPPQPQAKPEPQQQQAAQAEAILPMPKPAEKPTPPKPAAKPQQDMLASVLKNVEKLKAAERAKTPDVKSQAKPRADAQPKSMAPSLSERLTVSEEDALRRQIEQCWNPPIGARDAKTLVVEVVIIVNPDRTVQNAEVVDKSRATSDPYFRAAAEAAIRAVFNPRCSPLQLPDGKYEQWKRIDFNFDPREML